MARILLDSSVLISLFNSKDANHAKVVRALQGIENEELLISVISYTELLSRKTSKSEGVKRDIKSLVNGEVEISAEVAIKAGELRAEKDLGAPDALIAASALSVGAEVWTTDRKFAQHYKPAKYLA